VAGVYDLVYGRDASTGEAFKRLSRPMAAGSLFTDPS
jgi:hypothetical protein